MIKELKDKIIHFTRRTYRFKMKCIW